MLEGIHNNGQKYEEREIVFLICSLNEWKHEFIFFRTKF